MCKKKKKIEQTEPTAPEMVETYLEAMTDGEFLTNIDKLSEPSYIDYLSAPMMNGNRMYDYYADPSTVTFRRIVCEEKKM